MFEIEIKGIERLKDSGYLERLKRFLPAILTHASKLLPIVFQSDGLFEKVLFYALGISIVNLADDLKKGASDDGITIKRGDHEIKLELGDDWSDEKIEQLITRLSSLLNSQEKIFVTIKSNGEKEPPDEEPE